MCLYYSQLPVNKKYVSQDSRTVIPAQSMSEEGFGVHANVDKAGRDEDKGDADTDQDMSIG